MLPLRRASAWTYRADRDEWTLVQGSHRAVVYASGFGAQLYRWRIEQPGHTALASTSEYAASHARCLAELALGTASLPSPQAAVSHAGVPNPTPNLLGSPARTR